MHLIQIRFKLVHMFTGIGTELFSKIEHHLVRALNTYYLYLFEGILVGTVHVFFLEYLPYDTLIFYLFSNDVF